MRSLFYILTMVVLVGCGSDGGILPDRLPDDAYDQQVHAMILVGMSADPVLPTEEDDKPRPGPDEPRPGDKCPNLLGELPCRSGDGISRCTRCGGDGRLDKEDIQMWKARYDRKVKLYSTKEDGNGWPLRWYRAEASKIKEALGITVELVAISSGRPYIELSDGPISDPYFHELSTSDIVRLFDNL